MSLLIKKLFKNLDLINMNKPKQIIILCGIPCSGKSTWAKTNQSFYSEIISRDTIRENSFLNYKFSKRNEDIVTENLLFTVERCLEYSNPIKIIILDSCHTKEKYLDEIIKEYKNKHFIINIKFFDIPLWKAHYRNIIRYLITGKWIPIKVINSMYKNYNKINKNKYKQYV